MFNWLLRTDGDFGKTLQRLVLGTVFLAHGSQKLLGLWGGLGYSSTISAFVDMGIPAHLAFLVIFFEFFGGLGLLVGFLTRLWALGIGVIMAVAIAMVHWPVGFFMNWYGTLNGEGIEYHLLALALCFGLLLGGSGRYSIDRSLSK